MPSLSLLRFIAKEIMSEDPFAIIVTEVLNVLSDGFISSMLDDPMTHYRNSLLYNLL